MVQKIMMSAGLDPEDLGKAMLLQKTMIEAGADPSKMAMALQSSLVKSGMSLEHMITMMELGLKTTTVRLSPSDVAKTMQFEKSLGADNMAKMVMRKFKPADLNLLESVAKTISKENKDLSCKT